MNSNQCNINNNNNDLIVQQISYESQSANIDNSHNCDSNDNMTTSTTTSIMIPCSTIQIEQPQTNETNQQQLSSSSSSSTTIDHHNYNHDSNTNNNNDNQSYRSCNSITSILNFYRRYSNDKIFDANTFKQVKRLYCGMLLVAIAYSITMVIMMMVLYKSLPETIYNHRLQYQRFIQPTFDSQKSQFEMMNTNTIPNDKESVSSVSPILENESSKILANNRLWTMDTSGQTLYRHFNQQPTNRNQQSSFVSRTQLDQVIAVNFLTAILYIMAFYAAQREFYHLTLAFTTTLAVSMIISSVKILSEGSNFPNNLMGLLLRMSIVLTALIYSTQIRRKQTFINQAQTFWLNHPHAAAMLNAGATANDSSSLSTTHRSRSARSTTVQLIQEIFGVSASTGTLVATHPFHVNADVLSSTSKMENIVIQEYQDQPPDYEDALHCPVPFVRSLPVQPPPTFPRSTTSTISSSSSALSLISPPSFDQLKSQTTSLSS
ncbi:hypothetical protein DERP_001809 [Dermatophagoides pteronyssinus]|uniref:Uncharacterized protein n=1 Tax=Dermatophagoides pteronyssinus TaxID=6956 RepID=A0ABQ8JBJ5_DERPT|nr:hypothetical protein DERP_001809 [Dermatophagoides pteronyssinus]